MSYIFINRYCKVTANIPEKGITTLMGWITEATNYSLTLTDEHENHTHIMREQLVGSIVVLLEQPESNLQIKTHLTKEKMVIYSLSI